MGGELEAVTRLTSRRMQTSWKSRLMGLAPPSSAASVDLRRLPPGLPGHRDASAQDPEEGIGKLAESSPRWVESVDGPNILTVSPLHSGQFGAR